MPMRSPGKQRKERRPPERLDADRLYEAAVRALARRSRTRMEMSRLLERRAAVRADVAAVLERLGEHGYLDDARLAAQLVSFEKEVSCHGRARALRDLRARGVSDTLATAAVARDYAPDDEPTLLRAYIRKKRIQPPADLKQTARLYRKLMLAGFSTSACQRALRAWKLDPEWLEMVETELLEQSEEENPDE